MDVLDFISSRKVLVSKIKESTSTQTGKEQALNNVDYEARWKELKKVIRRENGKKVPCSATLKKATEELKALRRNLAGAGLTDTKRRTVVSCLQNTAPEPATKKSREWSDSSARRKEKETTRRFVLRMPAGQTMGTDVSIETDRLLKLNEKLNRNARGPLEDGPQICIGGVPQPMDRFNRRSRRR